MINRLAIVLTMCSMMFVACGKEAPEKKDPASTGEPATESSKEAVAGSESGESDPASTTEGKPEAGTAENTAAKD